MKNCSSILIVSHESLLLRWRRITTTTVASSNRAHPSRYAVCVYVCVQTSISDRPCVWSGTEPVIRGKLTQSFSTLCFLMFHFSPSLSLSASLACSFHLCLSFSDTDSAWLSVSVCLAGFSFNQSVSQSVWLSVYVFDLSLLSASWVACYFLLAFELFFFIIIKHTDNITQFHIRNANKTRIKSTTVSKSAS